jgi:cation:H+ antiporter
MIIIQFVLSSSCVILAGIFLARYADRIAKITGLGGLLVGSIFLAAATSLPELMIDVSAVRQGNPNLAVGNLFGSCLFNLLILAICDLLHRSRGRMISRASVEHALSATQSIALIALGGLGIILEPKIAPYALGPIGLSSIAIIGAYLLGLRVMFYDQRLDSSKIFMTDDNNRKTRRRYLANTVFGYLSAAVLILIAAPFVAESSSAIAEFTGLGNTFIGTSLLAFCTTLPEFVASLSAVRMGAYALAIGNVFGSNAFNMLLIAPLDFVSGSPLLATISPTHLVTCFAIIIITAVAVIGQLYQVEKRKAFLEPDAVLIVFLVIGALLGIYFLR